MYVRAVPGTPYEVRAATGSDVLRLQAGGLSDMKLAIMLAQACTYYSHGTRAGTLVWATEEDALAAPWPMLQRCSTEAMAVNGWSDGAESAEGK